MSTYTKRPEPNHNTTYRGTTPLKRGVNWHFIFTVAIIAAFWLFVTSMTLGSADAVTSALAALKF